MRSEREKKNSISVHCYIVLWHKNKACPLFFIDFPHPDRIIIVASIVLDKGGGVSRCQIFSWFLHKNIYCGYSLEASHWGTSYEYPQYMFSWRNKKNIKTFWLIKMCYLELVSLHGKAVSSAASSFKLLPLSGQSQQTKNWLYFSDFSQVNRLWHFMQLSPEETICMNCQSPFSWKNKKKCQNVFCWIFYWACEALVSQKVPIGILVNLGCTLWYICTGEVFF